jgi:hypothetical protein
MISSVDFLLDRSSTALLVFTAAAAVSRIIRLSPAARVAVGIAGVIVATLLPISGRSGFEWIVSAIERPSAPGLLLLIVFSISAVTGRRFGQSAEYRFGTGMLFLGGLALYPGAVGFLNYDTYVLGYGGYVLPVILAVILAYAIYRRYFFVMAALDIALVGFLLSAGRSLNLWDYVIDPVAWFLAIGAWITILAGFLIHRLRAPSPVAR